MRVLFTFGIRGGHSGPLRQRNLAAALARRPGFEVEIETRSDISTAVASYRPDVILAKGDFRRWVPFVGRARIVIDVHADLASVLFDQPWSLPRRLQAYVRTRIHERRFYPRVDGFTVVSESLVRLLRRYGRPTKLIPGGVDLALFRPQEAPKRSRVRITYAGSYRYYQGIPTLLEAFDILQKAGEPFELELVGDPGELGPRLATIPNVVLTGHVAQQVLPEILGRADILAIPRPNSGAARYGFPGKLAEYLAMGKAIVATDVGDHGRMIVDGQTGVLVPPGSAQALANGFRRLSDAAVRARLGAAARSLAEETLSWDGAGRVLADLLERVTAPLSSAQSQDR